ncbi:MAG: hypothetical protein AAFU71_19955 [Cyanobacteria bacterium J06632_22]
MPVYRSYLSVVTRPSGYAIAILLPKDESYAILGTSQLSGPYDPLHLLGYIVGLWDAAVNQPRLRQGLAPIGPHCLLCNQASELPVINQMFKQTGGIAAATSQPYSVTAEQTSQALQDLQLRLSGSRLQATKSLLLQLQEAFGSLANVHTFEDVPLSLAAIAQVNAYEQFDQQPLAGPPAFTPSIQSHLSAAQGSSKNPPKQRYAHAAIEWLQRVKQWLSFA